MSAKKTDISQIRKYLNGELDAAAMHKLEREAMDDPFLMDALEGYEIAKPEQQPHLTNLDQRLQQRIGEKPERKIIPWKYYAAAASLLLFFTLGYWAWNGRQQPKQLTAANETPAVDHVVTKTDTTMAADKSKLLKAASPQLIVGTSKQAEIKQASPNVKPDVEINSVTEAQAVRSEKNAKLDELLKKMEGMQVGADGSVTYQTQDITKVKLNGKEYAGGDMKQAIKNLPADIIEKAQVVDDYGDQAARAGVKKAAVMKADTVQYAAAPYKLHGKDSAAALNEVSVAGVAKLSKKDIVAPTTRSQTLKGKVSGVDVTIPPRISGVVLDQLGSPLAGATVVVDDKSKSAVTDAQGKFSIPAQGQTTLNINSLGYESAQVNAGADDNLQIKLKPSQTALMEVAIVPYNNAKRVTKTPQPRIGWDAYDQYLKRSAVSEKGEVGTVSLSFTVAPNGNLSDLKITKGATDALDQQAINIIKTGPQWYGDSSGEPKTVKLKVKFTKP